MGLSWDVEVPADISKEGYKWLFGIKDIANFSFPWCIVRNNSYKSVEMHSFSDVRRTAYAVTCFGRFIYHDGSVSLQFLFGKSKFCPVSGSLSIPCLELVAASLTTRVACSVLQESNIKYECVIYWFDSAATLHLIRNSTRRFGVFADAHLAEIRETSQLCNWRYFPTNLNPSDVGTRLIAPKKTYEISSVDRRTRVFIFIGLPMAYIACYKQRGKRIDFLTSFN